LGKTVVVTGASTGLGLESSVQLAELGAKVILAVRDIQKTKTNLQVRLATIPQNTRVELENRLIIWPVTLNLADFESIREFVNSLKNDDVTIDVLLNNAGCMQEEKQFSKTGVEWVFAVNQLGPFLLTVLCVPLLLKTPSPRIVILSSSLHRSGGTTFDFDDINWEKRNYNGMRAYSESKFANQLFSYALHRRVSGKIGVYTVHPGVVRTELGRDISWWKKIFFVPISYAFFKSTADGAKTQVFCSSSNDINEESGKYFGNCKSEPSSQESLNEESQEKMWDLSVKLTNVTEEELSVFNF